MHIRTGDIAYPSRVSTGSFGMTNMVHIVGRNRSRRRECESECEAKVRGALNGGRRALGRSRGRPRSVYCTMDPFFEP